MSQEQLQVQLLVQSSEQSGRQVQIQLQEEQLINLIDDDFIKMFQENILPVRQLMSCYRCAVMEIETKFKVLNEQFSLQHDRNPIDTIKTRLKTPESILKKLKKKNLPFSLACVEQYVNDVAGIRVICPFVDDIYMLADCLLRQDDIQLINQKDYIAQPKENGYRSLHLIVEVPIFLQNEKRSMKVEVQLRTIAMEFWASLEHRLRYKKNIDPSIAAQLATELSECAETSAMLDLRMKDIKDCIEHSKNTSAANKEICC